MTFSDIFKSSFLADIGSVSIIDVLLTLFLSFLLGLFIFLIYKNTYRGVMYSDSFAVSLIAMSTITSLIILAVTSNVILSLGMVGALSIVRFRTAVKEPMDIAFLFWAIAVGIVLGAGLVTYAVIGSVFIGIIILIFSRIKSHGIPYILVLNLEDSKSEAKTKEIIEENTKRRVLKSKTVSRGGIQLTYEVKLDAGDSDFVNLLSSCQGVHDATLVSYNGEYMS